MATPLLQINVPTVVGQNITFALPARRCFIISVGAALQFSSDGSTWTADVAASSTTGVEAAGAFTRSTTGNTVVTCRAS
jgi:hypothetical protein